MTDLSPRRVRELLNSLSPWRYAPPQHVNIHPDKLALLYDVAADWLSTAEQPSRQPADVALVVQAARFNMRYGPDPFPMPHSGLRVLVDAAEDWLRRRERPVAPPVGMLPPEAFER